MHAILCGAVASCWAFHLCSTTSSIQIQHSESPPPYCTWEPESPIQFVGGGAQESAFLTGTSACSGAWLSPLQQSILQDPWTTSFWRAKILSHSYWAGLSPWAALKSMFGGYSQPDRAEITCNQKCQAGKKPFYSTTREWSSERLNSLGLMLGWWKAEPQWRPNIWAPGLSPRPLPLELAGLPGLEQELTRSSKIMCTYSVSLVPLVPQQNLSPEFCKSIRETMRVQVNLPDWRKKNKQIYARLSVATSSNAVARHGTCLGTK